MLLQTLLHLVHQHAAGLLHFTSTAATTAPKALELAGEVHKKYFIYSARPEELTKWASRRMAKTDLTEIAIRIERFIRFF